MGSEMCIRDSCSRVHAEDCEDATQLNLNGCQSHVGVHQIQYESIPIVSLELIRF